MATQIMKVQILEEPELFNQIYITLYKLFVNAISKKKKMEYYQILDKKGRVKLPVINVDTDTTFNRSFEIFRVKYPELKYYSNKLILEYWKSEFDEVFNQVYEEDYLSEEEAAIDELINSLIDNI